MSNIYTLREIGQIALAKLHPIILSAGYTWKVKFYTASTVVAKFDVIVDVIHASSHRQF